MKFDKQQVKLLEQWLDVIDIKIQIEKDHNKRKQLNSKYIGGLRFIESMGGRIKFTDLGHVIYNLEKVNIPNHVDIKNYSNYRLLGAVSLMLNAGIFTCVKNDKLYIIKIIGG